jgi:hypothetical protein
MSFHLLPHPQRLVVTLAGILSVEDCQRLLASIDRQLEAGDARLLLRLEKFEGWHLDSRWREWRPRPARGARVSRIAVVGERRWHPWMAGLLRPFRGAVTGYFAPARLADAERWLARRADPR